MLIAWMLFVKKEADRIYSNVLVSLLKCQKMAGEIEVQYGTVRSGRLLTNFRLIPAVWPSK